MTYYSIHTWPIMLLTLMSSLVALVACSDHNDDFPTVGITQTTGDTYVCLQIKVPTGDTSTHSRAASDYDDEAALERENEVKRISVIFFRSMPDGINTPKASEIRLAAYCYDAQPLGTSGAYTTFTTGSQRLPAGMEYGTYNVLLIANADYSAYNGKTLADLRDALYAQQPFTESIYLSGAAPERCTDFVMASAADAEVIIGTGSTHDGSYADAFTTTDGQPIAMERLAARIDFVPNAAYQKTDADGSIYYEYPVTKDDGSATNSKFRLRYVAPFNTTRSQYLFRHTQAADASTKQPTGDVTLLGSEDGRYVIDPLTALKGLASTSSEVYAPFYVPQNRYEDLPKNTALLRQRYGVRVGNHANPDDAANPYFIVDYTAENTLTVATQNAADMINFATGLRFFGSYVPNGVDADAFDRAYDYRILHRMKPSVDTSMPLTYGIVRNCIYRVSIKSVTQTPDNFNITLQIKVVPWQKFVHSEIIM